MRKNNIFLQIGFNTTVQFIGKGMSVILSFISIAILTKYLGVSVYGNFSLIFAYLLFFSSLGDFGLQTTVVNKLAQYKKKESEIFGTYLLIKIVLIIFSTMLSLIILLFMPYSNFIKVSILFSSIGVGIGALNGFGNTFFQYKLRLDIITIIDVVNKFITVVLIGIFVYFRLNFFFILSSVLIGNALSVCLTFVILRRMVVFKYLFIKEIATDICKVSFPIGIAGILAAMYFKLDMIMLSFFKTSKDVGMYALSYKIFETCLMIWSFYMASFYPYFVKFYHAQDSRMYKKFLKNAFMVAFLLSVSLMIFGLTIAPFVINIMGGNLFVDSTFSLQLLLFSSFFFFANSIFYAYFFIIKKTKLIIVFLSFSLMFNFLINLFFIPKFSFMGATYTTILTEIFLFLCYTCSLWGKVKRNL